VETARGPVNAGAGAGALGQYGRRSAHDALYHFLTQHFKDVAQNRSSDRRH